MRQKILLLFFLLFLSLSLGLTVGRIQQPKPVTTQPRAEATPTPVPGGDEKLCNQGDCGSCSYVANYYSGIDKAAACSWANKGIQCLKDKAAAGKTCSCPFNDCSPVGCGRPWYVNPPIYGPTDTCTASSPQTCNNDCIKPSPPPQCASSCMSQVPVDMCAITRDNCGAGGTPTPTPSGGGGCPAGPGPWVSVYVKENSESGPNYHINGEIVRMMGISICGGACNAACCDPVCKSRDLVYDSSKGFVRWRQTTANTTYGFGLKDFAKNHPNWTTTPCSVNTAQIAHCTIVVNTGGATPTPTPTPGGSPTPTPSNSPTPTPTASPSPTPTPTPMSTPTPTPTPIPLCPNPNNPFCFDCNGDHAVNVLDFACFRTNYGKNY